MSQATRRYTLTAIALHWLASSRNSSGIEQSECAQLPRTCPLQCGGESHVIACFGNRE